MRIKREVEYNFPKQRVHVVSAGCKIFAKYPGPVDHIDLTCLLIPSKKLLFVDENFHSDLSTFEKVAEQENLELIGFKPVLYESEWGMNHYLYPLNCLVLPQNGKERIFANKNVPSFLKILEKYGLDVIEIDMQNAPIAAQGSIRCCTNTKLPQTSLADLLDFNWV